MDFTSLFSKRNVIDSLCCKASDLYLLNLTSEHRNFLVIRFFKYRWKRSNNCIICQVCNAVYFT